MNGPLKNESRQILPKSQNLAQPTNGLRISDFVSVCHIFAFLSSHCTFSSRTRILKCQSCHLGKSRIYYSPPLLVSHDNRYTTGTHHAGNIASLKVLCIELSQWKSTLKGIKMPRNLSVQFLSFQFNSIQFNSLFALFILQIK